MKARVAILLVFATVCSASNLAEPSLIGPILTGCGGPCNITVTISADPAATVHYTTDGTQPSVASANYTSPLILPSPAQGVTITVQAFAMLANGTRSSMASQAFTVYSTIPTVDTSTGPVQGNQSAYIASFLGIPFGTSKRFSASTMATPWTTVFQAIKFGSSCLQPSKGQFVGSEDCLTVNVWAPRDAWTNGAKLPVLLWIYGGGFIFGESKNPLYDGSRLVAKAQDVILISINYRLGPLGFISLPSGSNFGLGDQRLGMQWVQANAAKFGGDPTRVTLWGQSAGGISVCLHLLSPLSKGLFSAVAIDSGNCNAPRSQAAQMGISQEFAAMANCSSPKGQLACLQALSVQQVFAVNHMMGGDAIFSPAYGGPVWQPCVDGVMIVRQPLETIALGAYDVSVPVMMGATTGSMTLFMLEAPPPSFLVPTNQTQLDALISTILKPPPGSERAAAAVRAYYMNTSNFPNNYGHPYRAAAASFLSDAVFICGTQVIVQGLARRSTVKYWMFDHRPDCFPNQETCIPVPDWVGAFHGSELAFVFNATLLGSPVEAQLEETMQQTYLNWAASHSAPWDSYSATTPITRWFNTAPPATVSNYNHKACSLLSALAPLPPSPPPPETPPEDKPDTLNTVAIVLIVLGSVLGVALFAFVLVRSLRARRRSHSRKDTVLVNLLADGDPLEYRKF